MKKALYLLILLAVSCSQPVTFVHMTDPQIGFRDRIPPFSQSDTLMQKAVFDGHTHGDNLGHGSTGIYRIEVNKEGIEVAFVPTTIRY